VVGKPEEKAVLTIGGQEFRDWESVMVRHAVGEQPPYRFRFTCSEAVPIANNFAALQIVPGDDCTVTLAGELAITGKVSTRQVYYDKRRHYVEIQGATKSEVLAKSSPVTKTMEHKDVTYDQLAKSLLKAYNIPFKVEGGEIKPLKFPRVSLMHGLSTFDHLDLYGRNVGVKFTSDPEGSFVALVGPGEDSEDTLIEGENILVGREIIYSAALASDMPGITQGPGDDKKSGAAVTHMPFWTQSIQQFTGSANQFAPFVIPMELPTVDKQHMEGRTSSERDWMSMDQVTVFITVYGWLRPSGGLWKRFQTVHVKSPMLVMDNELKVKSATFTQDSAEGTKTVLECVNRLSDLPQLENPGPSRGDSSTSGSAAP